jgi:DNA-binding CsgD family transcriptional regulator
MRSQFPNAKVFVQTFDRDKDAAQIAHARGYSREELVLYNGRFGRVDVLARAAASVVAGTAFARRALVDAGALSVSEFHTDYLRQWGDYSAGAGVHLSASSGRTWSIHCAVPSDATAEADLPLVSLLQELAPTLIDFYERAESQVRLPAHLAAGTDLFAFPMFSAGLGRPIEPLNTLAEELLACESGIRLRDGRLELFESDSTVSLQLAADLQDALGGGRRSSYLQFANDRSSWLVAVMPVPFSLRAWAIDPLAGRPACMVCFIRLGERAHIPANRIAARFQLTRAEAELVGELVRGRSLERTATANGVSIHTVRTQLRNAAGKVGAHSQADLVGRVLSDPLIAFHSALAP